MLSKRFIIDKINKLLRKVDIEIERRSTLEKFRSEICQLLPNERKSILSSFILQHNDRKDKQTNGCLIPDGALQYLSKDNEKLLHLKESYDAFGAVATAHSAWGDGRASNVDLANFRGDSPYVWQNRDDFEINYLLTAYYVMANDPLGLFDLLREDRLFGIITYEMKNGRLISRDYLDSILEINFLARFLKQSFFKGARIVDIGAGYGRLAYGLTTAFSQIDRVLCTDAIPESTFLCEYYLHFRGVEDKAISIPLPEIEAIIGNNRFQLATNIHSFSECQFNTICWWLDLLTKGQVEYLFVVPNGRCDSRHHVPPLLSRETNGPGIDFEKEILARGYRLLIKEPKFVDFAVNRYGIAPTGYYLFKLE